MLNHSALQHTYEAFVESLSASIDDHDLAAAMAVLLDVFEVGRFAYLELPSHEREQSRLISNYPIDWTSFYLGQHYDLIDPVIEMASCRNEPFVWGRRFNREENSIAQVRLFDEAAEFGICSGLTIPIHDRRGKVAALTFASNEASPALLRMSARYQRALQMVATCFHIQARRVHSDERSVDGRQLTPREFECLQWAAKGKSAWEIGQILGIKRRTVAFHLDNTRHKLGVRTIAQAVVLLASKHKIPD